MPEPISTLVLFGYAAMQVAACPRTAVSAEAKIVRKAAANVLFKGEQSEALFGIRNAAVSQLIELFENCREADWDGAGADPLNGEALYRAIQFVRLLPANLPMPEFAPEPDGSVSLDWMHSKRRRLSVSIGRSDRLAYAWLDGTRKGHAVERFDAQTIPVRILEEILRIMNYGNVALRVAC